VGAGLASLPLDHEAMEALRALDAAGATQSVAAGTWPVTRAAGALALVEARERPGLVPGVMSALLAGLGDEFVRETTGDVRGGGVESVEIVALSGDFPFRSWNSFGRADPDGPATRLAARASVPLGPRALLTATPEAHTPWEGDSSGESETAFRELSARLALGRWCLEYGTDSLWWGYGAHGSLLLGDDAPPFRDMLVLATRGPALMPGLEWPVHVACFTTRLADERAGRPPRLSGARVEMRPRPNVTFGLARTSVHGGEGMGPDDLDALAAVLTGSEEGPGRGGDLRTAADLAVRFPSRAQPVMVYVEAAGEEVEWGAAPVAGLLAGIYLPRIGRASALDLRLEWASTSEGGRLYGTDWCPEGYTYFGRPLGHHAGPDADDRYVALGWRSGSGARGRLWYDVERRRPDGFEATEARREAGIELVWRASGGWRVGFAAAWQDRTNVDGVAGASDRGSLQSLSLAGSF
jgi:hypothetical protein